MGSAAASIIVSSRSGRIAEFPRALSITQDFEVSCRQSSFSRNTLLIPLCFFLSGTAGLIYEVAWVKALGLIFGHTVYAVAAVLAVFMGGIAAGSVYLGRHGARHTHSLTLYARIELLIALTGILSIPGLLGVKLAYIASYPALSHFPPLLLGMRLLGSALVLFIPTFLMGGTFPILVAGTVLNKTELNLQVSRLYWTNTAGAVVGALLAGFLLLPALGLRLTICSAAALNLLAAVVAFDVLKNAARTVTKRTRLLAHTSEVQTSFAVSSVALLWLFAAVGCSALAYEIAWTRLLAIAIGSSTYAFTLMLATFLTGIVLGSVIFHRLVSYSAGWISIPALAWLQMGLGLTTLSSLIAFHWIPSLVPPLLRASELTFAGTVVTQFVAIALTLLPAAILSGFAFPMLIALIDQRVKYGDEPHHTVVGNAYAANTAGAIAGSLAAGFWLVPWLGSFKVIAAFAGVNLFLAMFLHLKLPRNRLLNLATDALLMLGVVLVASSSFFDNPQLLSFSALLYGNAYQGRLTSTEVAATMDLVYSAEGANESIAVVRSDGDVALRVNGKIDASTQDTRTQLLLGHLGAAFHPAPKRVLIIGFGSGMTASAIARYRDVQRIDCIEIEPAVLRAAPYLGNLNRGVLNDRRLHIILDDARNFLLTSRDKYDLIISEPSNPWIAGVATLFTEEFYAAARQRLSPGGIFVQWVQGYSLAPADLRMMVHTFAGHFPEVTLWRGEQTDLLLLGRTNLSYLNFNRLRSLWQDSGIRQDFAALDVNQPEGLMAYFLLDNDAVQRLAKGGRSNTDDRTLLEYDAPRNLLNLNSITTDQDLIARFRRASLPPNLDRQEIGRTLGAALATALDLNDAANAAAMIPLLDSEPESAARDVAKGRLALLQGATVEAQTFLRAARRLDPASPDAAYWLAVAERRSGNINVALSLINALLKFYPKFSPALEQEMEIAAHQNNFHTAVSAQLARMALMPDPPAYEYGRLGALWISISNFSEAKSALLKGLAKDPYCYACHLELGELYLRTGEFSLSRQNLQWVIRFFPDSDAVAYRSLVAVDLILHDNQGARKVLSKGLRVFPNDPALLKAQAGLTAFQQLTEPRP